MSTIAHRRKKAAAAARAKEPPVVAFEPWRHGAIPRMHEAWYHRRLLGYTSAQFILKRYRQTYLGWLWIVLRPAIQIATTTLFVGGFLQAQYGDRPAIIFISFSGAGWIIFERAFHWGMRSVRMTAALSKGLHMPRFLAAVSAAAPAFVDFFMHFLVAMGAVAFFIITQGTNYLAPPPQWIIAIVGLIWMVSWGLVIGLITGPLMMITKEVRYLQTYVLQLWMIVTPVVYDINHIPEKYRAIAEYNPLTAPIEMIQFGFLSTSPVPFKSLATSLITFTILLFGSLSLFSRFERAAVARL